MAEVGRQDLFAEAIQVSDDEREAVLAPGDDGLVLGHLRVAVDQIIKLRGEPACDVRFAAMACRGDGAAAAPVCRRRVAAMASRRKELYPTGTPPWRRLLVGARAFDGDAVLARKVEAHGGGPITPNRFATLLRTSRARFSARPSGRRRVLERLLFSA